MTWGWRGTQSQSVRDLSRAQHLDFILQAERSQSFTHSGSIHELQLCARTKASSHEQNHKKNPCLYETDILYWGWRARGQEMDSKQNINEQNLYSDKWWYVLGMMKQGGGSGVLGSVGYNCTQSRGAAWGASEKHLREVREREPGTGVEPPGTQSDLQFVTGRTHWKGRLEARRLVTRLLKFR